MRDRAVREAILFFAVTIFLSYFVFWGPIALFHIPTVNLVNGARGPVWAIVLFILGGFVPSIVGIGLTGIYEGKTGVRELMSSAFKLGIGAKWYSYIIFVVLGLAAALIAVNFSLGGTFDFAQFLVQLPSALPLIVLGPLSEEFGWRGFATRRLLRPLGGRLTSLVTGLVWAFWHLPLFYMLGAFQHESDMSFIAFALSVVGLSFVYTYVYARTNNNLFSAVFFHWVYTYVFQVVGSTVSRSGLYNWLECLPALMIGFLFSLLMRSELGSSHQSSEQHTI